MSAKVIEEKEHAPLSPSASKRWMTCPGSVALIDSLNIQDTPSKYAAEGTVAHEVGELCLRNNKEPSEYLGRKFTSDGFTFTVTQEMVDAVQVYTDYIRDVIEQAELQADVTVDLAVEVRCCLRHYGVKGMNGGTSDSVLVCHEHQFIEVVDYKHGAGVAVEADNNSQALSYALGALYKAGVDELDDWTVIITIVQPRAMHQSGPIRSVELRSSEIYEWAETKLIPAALATLEPDAALVPSEDGCRFCLAAGNCKALHGKTQEVAMLDFESLDEQAQLPDPRTLTAEQKRIVMDHADMIRSFIVKVEEQIKREVDNGSQEYENHYKLVRKTTHRKLTELATDEDFSPLLDHLTLQDLHQFKVESITAIESKLKRKLKEQGYTGKELTTAIKEIMEQVTEKPEGSLVIAPQSDRREAVLPSIVSDFTGLED